MKLNLKGSESTRGKEADDNDTQNHVPVLRRAAMDYLARREHSFYELRQKLCRKFPDVEYPLLQQVLLQLRNENLQSDERFTEAYVRYRKSRGFGYLHIRAELLGRRVEESLVQKYLQADDSDWLEIAGRQLENKMPSGEKLLFGSKLHRKLVRFLESRGFGSLDIRRILERHLVSKSAR